MKVAAGYAEHVDVQVGRITDELEALGYADNTLFLYIWGDNGSSGEGQNGTISGAVGTERDSDHRPSAHRRAR